MNADQVNLAEIDSLASTTDDSSDCSCDEEEEAVILCELVGARKLSLQEDQDGEFNSGIMQPFCVVRYGGEIIHKTKPAEDSGPNPIWTVSRKSLFLIKAKPREMSQRILNISICAQRQDALPVRLMTSEALFLGQVNLDSTSLLANCDEQRLELDIQDELGEKASSFGTISLRLRLATESDQHILRLLQMSGSNLNDYLNQSQKDFMSRMLEGPPAVQKDLFPRGATRPLAPLVTELPESVIAQSSFINAISYAFTSNKIRDKSTGLQKFRIKPNPDPDQVEETKFMTSQEISLQTRRPSQRWIEAGSGSLGKIYLEILACHDLPNVDIGEAVGNVTDSFVCAVFEDSVAMTEVIDDELSPHWLPWSQRAFCFGMMHPASILYLGVFDYDLGIGNHDPLGRVAVNLCNLQRNTMYTLKYNLYPSSNVTDRTANGSITIRLRVECLDQKTALLEAIKPRPKIHVNVRQEKSFKVVRYTCFGEYGNEENFDLTVTRSYITEILEYKSALDYGIRDSLQSLVFWRGQVEVFSVLLPVHSFVFFCSASTLVERPYMIVPFTFLGIAWIMLATLTRRRQHPSPWHSCPSFWHYLTLLRTGESPRPITSITEYEGSEAAQAYDQAWSKRLEEDRKVAEKKAELQLHLDSIGDENISTKADWGAILPLDLLNRLGRYQGIIGGVCKFFRLIKIIVTWEEGVVSFWITAGFLLAGIVSLLLPWTFLLTWTGRLIVWGLLGPQMKVADLILHANKKNDATLRELIEKFDVQSKIARIRREEALKLKDMKCLAFGEYSIQVPSFNLARHYDRPLPESSASLCRLPAKLVPGAVRRPSAVELPITAPWIPGQQLYGAMIPRPELEATLYRQEALRQRKRLANLELRVKTKTLRTNSVPKSEVRKFIKMGEDTNLPSSLGYEIVPDAEHEEHSREEEVSNSRMLVVLSDNDNDTSINLDRSGILVLESDGTTTYAISPDNTVDEPEEEGVEIIGLGRLSTLCDVYDDDMHLLHQVRSVEEDDYSSEADAGLSRMYQASERVHVGFYRPPKKILEGSVSSTTEEQIEGRISEDITFV